MAKITIQVIIRDKYSSFCLPLGFPLDGRGTDYHKSPCSRFKKGGARQQMAHYAFCFVPRLTTFQAVGLLAPRTAHVSFDESLTE
jgi:hypothetical protein